MAKVIHKLSNKEVRNAVFGSLIEWFQVVKRVDTILFSIILFINLLYLTWRIQKFEPVLIVSLIVIFGSFLYIFGLLIYRMSQLTDVRARVLWWIRDAASMSKGGVSLVKLDVDLISAINEYAYIVGARIIEYMDEAIRKVSKTTEVKLKVFKIPEADERLILIYSDNARDVIELANYIRRYVKERLKTIARYQEAKNYVVQKLNHPSLQGEERENIGTISAGISMFKQSAEQLLAEASDAVKTAKFRGRNKTILFTKDQDYIIIDNSQDWREGL